MGLYQASRKKKTFHRILVSFGKGEYDAAASLEHLECFKPPRFVLPGHYKTLQSQKKLDRKRIREAKTCTFGYP